MLPLAWKSTKIRWIVRSTIAAETLSMVDILDAALCLGHLFSEILYNCQKENRFPLVCFTKNRSLFENILSTKTVGEKRLRVDIAGIKQMLQRKEISNIQKVPSSQQISDCLTKRGASTAKLLEILQTGQRDPWLSIIYV